MGIADPLLPNLDFGQTPATPRRSRTRFGGPGLGARFRVPDAPRKRCGARIRLRPPAPDRHPRLGEAAGGESPEGSQRSHNALGSPSCRARPGPRSASALRGLSSPAWLGPGAKPEGALEGKQSPWKDRMSHRWQRRSDITDSSAEQSLGVGCFAFFRQVRPSRDFGSAAALCGLLDSFGRRAARLSRPRVGLAGASQRLARASPPSLGT
jgi:hypothetical protein